MDIHSAVYTFSCFAEGHVGMDIEENQSVKDGKNKAMTKEELIKVQDYFKTLGASPVLYSLKKMDKEPDAFVLHIPSGVQFIGANPQDTFDEMKALGKDGMDSQFLHRSGKIKNKLARWNFNVGDRHQDADIQNGKNTLYNFTELPSVHAIRIGLNKIASHNEMDHMKDLLAEANVYYNDTCGIRYHGDEERDGSPVIGVNFGEDRYLCYRSFFKHRFFGEEFKLKLCHGDMYFMSEEAVGIGWLRKTHQKVIFRHRAGSVRFLEKHDKELKRRDAKKDAKLKEKASKKRQRDIDSLASKKKPKITE